MCCKGYLPADVYGHVMNRNNFCHFLSESTAHGCTIYSNRPEFCSAYNCVWKEKPELLPNWMKPNLSDVILTWRQYETNNSGIDRTVEYIEMTEGHEKVKVEVLNFVIQMCVEKGINLKYEVDRCEFYIGDEFFLKEMKIFY